MKTAAGVVEPVDVLEDSGLCLPSCRPFLTPDQLRLQRFEERFKRGVVVAVAFATHRWQQALGLQLLLIIIGTVLATTIRMEDAAFGRFAQVDRHIERPDCKILLHSIADRPANDTAAV